MHECMKDMGTIIRLPGTNIHLWSHNLSLVQYRETVEPPIKYPLRKGWHLHDLRIHQKTFQYKFWQKYWGLGPCPKISEGGSYVPTPMPNCLYRYQHWTRARNDFLHLERHCKKSIVKWPFQLCTSQLSYHRHWIATTHLIVPTVCITPCCQIVAIPPIHNYV